MATIRRFIWLQAAASVVAVLIGGIIFPTVHRLEHAAELAHRDEVGTLHHHSDHDAAVENPFPNLLSDSCWLCIRQIESTLTLYSPFIDRTVDALEIETLAESAASVDPLEFGLTRAPPRPA